MTRFGVRAMLVFLAPMLSALGCSGRVEEDADSPSSGGSVAGTGGGPSVGGSTGSASSSGGLATGGTGADTGGQTSAGGNEPASIVLGDGTFPIFGGSDSEQGLIPWTAGEELEVATSETETRQWFGVHLPNYDFKKTFSGLEFTARASEGVTLVITLGPLSPMTPWEVEEGFTLQGATIELGTDEQQVSVGFSDMGPLDGGEPYPLGSEAGSAIGISFAQPSTTVWFGEITLVPQSPER